MGEAAGSGLHCSWEGQGIFTTHTNLYLLAFPLFTAIALSQTEYRIRKIDNVVLCIVHIFLLE